MQEPISHKEVPLPARPTSPPLAIVWLTIGIVCPLLFLVLAPVAELKISAGPLVIYLVCVLGLDLFVGASSGLVTAQRITPAVVLGLLLTPGIPSSIALVVDLIGVATVAATSRFSYDLLAQVGRALIPASATATYLYSKTEIDSGVIFFACEIFILAALLTRSNRPPFRTDIFLIISYPAVALLLSHLTQASLAYVLLAVPLLFLLTTVETNTLGRYLQLRKKLVQSQTEIQQSRLAQKQTEIESRRKGVLLSRKEQQLSLLNGLGRQLDAAQAAEDLGTFLLKESLRLTGADSAVLLLNNPTAEFITQLLSFPAGSQVGLKEGQKIPPLRPSLISSQPPWPAPIWNKKQSYLTTSVGGCGFLILAKNETEAFPDFLKEFFSAVGRHAGSSMLALHRLNEVRAIAQREAQEKRNVAAEKEKVAEQKQHLEKLHSQLQHSYTQLQRTQQEIVLSSQWAAAGRLAANAAHELNTPLGAVRIAAEHILLYLQYGGDPEPAKESMVSLLNSVDKCRRVTDRLLLTSRPVDQGAQPLKAKIEKLEPIITDAIASVSPYLRVTKVKLDSPKPLPDYQGFVVYQDLYWAIVNILKNGIDAVVEANPEEKQLTLTLEKTQEHIVIIIKDNGTGVPLHVQSRLFEPFYTTKKLGQGNGLGLSMSQTNLRRWHGDIFYQDRPEGGSIFIMKVPRA